MGYSIFGRKSRGRDSRVSGITALEAVGAFYTGGLVGGGPKRVENLVSVTYAPRAPAMCPPWVACIAIALLDMAYASVTSGGAELLAWEGENGR